MEHLYIGLCKPKSCDEHYEGKLISLMNEEFACCLPQTTISLNRIDKYGSFPGLVLHCRVAAGTIKCLTDVQDRIYSIIQNDESIINKRGYSGLTPLHLICSLHSPGRMKILKILCSQRNSYIDILDSLSRTPLHHSLSPPNLEFHSGCEDGGSSLVNIVTFLIDHGADVNAVDFHGLTPLHFALDYYKSGSANKLRELPRLIETLIQAGANTQILAPQNLSCLHLGCRLCCSLCTKVIDLLISPDNVNIVDKHLRTPLHEAIRSAGNRKCASIRDAYNLQGCEYVIDKVRSLLENGADIDAADVDDMTPISMALELFNYSFCAPLVKLLLEKKAKVNMQENGTGTTPLHYACSTITKNFDELISLFLESGGSLNTPDSNSITPFHTSLKNPRCDVSKVEFLITRGADPFLKDNHGNNSIHMVCQNDVSNFEDMVSFLVEKGCDVNEENHHGNTPLLVLLLKNHHNKNKIQTLINLGASCNTANFERISPLHMVSRSLVFFDDIHEIVDTIMRAGAEPNATDVENNTPLHYAVRDDTTVNIKAIRRLLSGGADPNIKNSLGITPLHIVCSSGGYYLAKLLLAFGADVNSLDSDSNTPLHVAQCATENADATVQVLINHGANLSSVNSKGATPFQSMGKNTYYFMIGYTVLFTVAKHHRLSYNESSLISGNKLFLKRYDDCFSCAKSMQSQYLGDSSVTLMDFLLATDKKAARYIRNSRLLYGLEILGDSAKYRWYRSMINSKIQQATFINELIARSIVSFRKALLPFHLPDVIIENILGYSDVYDMNALNCAVVEKH